MTCHMTGGVFSWITSDWLIFGAYMYWPLLIG